MTQAPDVTDLLVGWSAGKASATDRLMAAVYAALRRLARGYRREKRPDHSPQLTALVHQAYLALVKLRGEA